MNVPSQNTRLPLIGRIKCGEKKINTAGKEYPVSLDYFIAAGAYASKFNEVYDKPNKIQIVFISDDDFQSCYEEWDGRDKEGRRAGYGDGETYYLWNYGKDDYTEVKIAGDNADKARATIADFTKKHAVKWKQVLTINFIIPAIKGVFGVWQLQTGGDKSSINAIRNTFDEIKESVGTIVNIPFDLCVKKVTSNKPEAKSVYPVITLVPNISAENMEQLRAFFAAGLDVKKLGMLNEEKLSALAPHQPNTEVTTMAENEDLSPAEKETATRIVIDEIKKSGKTVLDVSAEIKERHLNKDHSDTTREKDIEYRIANSKTVRELQEIFSTEPLLFMEDDTTPLNVKFTERMNELKNGQ
jgi:hypothetical protein